MPGAGCLRLHSTTELYFKRNGNITQDDLLDITLKQMENETFNEIDNVTLSKVPLDEDNSFDNYHVQNTNQYNNIFNFMFPNGII